MGYVKLFTDEFFNENHADFRYYVTCFSYQNDLLSQWRGYADDGRGAAIGFDLDVLKEVVTVSPEISKPSIVSLHKISYSETEQREVVHQIVHELVDEIEKILQKEEQCRESIEEKQDYEIEVLDKVMNCFEKKVFEIISGICLHEKSVLQRGKRNPIVRVFAETVSDGKRS